MTKELLLLRSNILAPYKKYFRYDSNGKYVGVDLGKLADDNKGVSAFGLMILKSGLLAALELAAAINKTIEELRGEQAKNKEIVANSSKP